MSDVLVVKIKVADQKGEESPDIRGLDRSTSDMTDATPPEVDVVCALDALDAYVARIAEAERLDGASFDVRAGSKAGDNYVGVVHKVTLRGRRRDADSDADAGLEVSLALVYKCQPDSVERRRQLRTGDFFANEAVVYNVVLPTFARFQTSKRLPADATFASYPACYHADADALLLEDMTPRGFTMRDRQQPLDLAHCSLIMQEMGRFHALSFALRDQRPDEFEVARHAVKETLYIPVERVKMHFWTESATNAEAKFVELSRFGGVEKYARALRAFVENYYPAMVECVRGDAAEPYAVITHGDCWTNNILFKYGEDPAIPESLCFLDFQIARYGSPVNDLVYVLFSCTEQSLRAAHFDALIKVYHYSLSRFLRELGSDPEQLFPFSALQSQWSKFGKFGVGSAIRFMQFFTCPTADAPDLDAACDNDAVDVADALLMGSAECWRRLNGVIEDSVDRGFIG